LTKKNEESDEETKARVLKAVALLNFKLFKTQTAQKREKREEADHGQRTIGPHGK
jgi:hypothetical protein